MLHMMLYQGHTVLSVLPNHPCSYAATPTQIQFANTVLSHSSGAGANRVCCGVSSKVLVYCRFACTARSVLGANPETLKGNLEQLRTALGAQSAAEVKGIVLYQPRLLTVQAKLQREKIQGLMVSYVFTKVHTLITGPCSLAISVLQGLQDLQSLCCYRMEGHHILNIYLPEHSSRRHCC